MTAADLTITLPGYRLVEQIYSGSRTVVYRGVQEQSEHRPVAIKLLHQEYPTFNDLLQFRNQYALAKNLDIPGIVRPLCLELYRNSYALVMEDFGGVSLRDYAKKQALTVGEVLAIALQLTDILNDLHQNRVIHKDIKPANILIHPQTKQVKLIDFSIASLLPKETQEIKNPNVLEGTLSYLSPEQTGRMNRGIDYRADFYALGVTLFELLTGELPFQSNDPMELVHCHIAKQPPSLGNRQQATGNREEISLVLSDIVKKLMAKNAEDRYQSALGLQHDLQICLEQWEATGKIEWFEIGKRDLCDRFIIPEKLYGREAEVQTLLAAFERTGLGSSELMLVAGFSGIGKTAVVNEVQKPIVRQRGYFIKGKFDQFNRNIPLRAFLQALRDLIGQLLSESDLLLAQWKTKILAAIGDNGQLLIEVLPELERIVGKQPPVAELSGTAAQNRFNLLFQKFIAIFTTKEHPLVMFLDDLQWADLASLQLIKVLMEEQSYLLLLGAYRDNEVQAAHPFILTVEELQKSGKTVNTITLAPLTFRDTNQLVADTLHCSIERSRPFAELIDRKTQGNPFFITQFLKALHESGYITFNRDNGYWECDLAQINALSLTDDVVEFMAQQLQKLPAKAQQLLQLAACIGNQFDLATLAAVSQRPTAQILVDMWEILPGGLIIPTNDFYKFYQGQDATTTSESVLENCKYQFLHDRVQQAAYQLIPEDRKQITHLTIGRLLLEHIPPEQQEENIFAIVNHLNVGLNLISSQETELVARLNLMAGRKAKLSTAYSAAQQYLLAGIGVLDRNSWQHQYDLTLSLYAEAVEVSYLCTNFEQMEQLATVALSQAKTLLDRVKIDEIKIQACQSQGNLSQGVKIALNLLHLIMGLNIYESKYKWQILLEQSKFRFSLLNRKIEDLNNLPAMQDPMQLAIARILAGVASSVYFTNAQLWRLLVLKSINLSIKYGNAPVSPSAYIFYAIFLCSSLERFEQGYRFGQLALKLSSESSQKHNQAFLLFSLGVFIQPWREHWRNTMKTLLTAYQKGLETGELEFITNSVRVYCVRSYFTGTNLSELESEMETYGKVIAQFKQQRALHWHQIYWQTVLNLQGKNDDPQVLNGNCYDEQARLAELQSGKDRNAAFTFYFNKLVLSYLFENADRAVTYADLAEQYLDRSRISADLIAFDFYSSLARLSICQSQSATANNNLLSPVVTYQQKLKQWAISAPMNFVHKFDLLEAEQQRISGNFRQAIEFYDRAIAGAKENGYIQEEAIANELAAKFYLAWNKEKVAASYMQEAYYCYARWGSSAKTEDLEQRYPNLLRPILQQAAQSLTVLETIASIAPAYSIHSSGSQSFSTSLNHNLDFASLLQVSQVLCSSIQLNDLMQTLAQTMLENSGADKCALMLCQEGEWQVRVISDLAQTSLQTVALENNPTVPVKLIQYVKNTLEVVTIDDLKTDLPSIIDDYFEQYRPKSVLCFPLLNQGNLIGILYLENRLTSGVFTSDRLIVLNFLCTQAAISLENARLYQTSKEYSQNLEQTLALSDGQHRILEMVAQGAPLNRVLEQLALLIESQSRETVYCSFLLLEDDKRLVSGAAPSLPPAYNDAIKGMEIGPIAGSCGTAAYYKASVIVEDIANDPLWANFQIALDYGLKACLSTPILSSDGEVLATLAMYHPCPYKPTKHDCELLYKAAYLARIAIERYQAQAALKQQAQDLEEAFERLQQVQLQLVQNEKMSALGNLVAGVAHEINNPIGFLNGSIDNAKEYVQDLLEHLELYQQCYPDPAASVQNNAEDIDLEFLAEDLPKLLDSMQGATDRIKNISTSLRTFSRADTDRKVSANLHEGLDSTLLILKYRLKANEYRPAINVIKEYGDLPQIDCFPGQLNQVFMNILANAIDMFDEMAKKHSFAEIEPNRQQIIIRTELVEDWVKINIQDNGAGIAEAVKAKMFDHLFTTKAVGKGTGLGLAIARQIVVEKHGGSLEANSTLGKGTEFTILLPAKL